MILPLIFVLVLIVGIVFLNVFKDASKLYLLGLISTFVSSVGCLVCFIVIMTTVGEQTLAEQYEPLKKEYDFILKQDSIPFEIKKDLFEKCSNFNYKLDNAIKFEHNIWRGWFFHKPDSTVEFFDLKKFDY